jgi:hypothetical protein
LVPWFQFFHKSIEWRRINQFEEYKSKIANKEQFLKEFITLSALLSEAYEVSKNKDLKVYSKNEIVNKINEIQTNRFNKIAKINYLLIFIDNVTVPDLVEKHTKESLKLMTSLKNLAFSSYTDDQSPNNDELNWIRLYRSIKDINSIYNEIANKVFFEIKRVKDENKNLHML